MQTEKTIFISYRRTSYYTALTVFHALKARGYDVFFDFESIDSGSFEQTILNQIRARAHFLLILQADTLSRCNEPSDWVRREIEMAIAERRNVIPMTFDDFDWKQAEPYLVGQLAVLREYNGLEVPRGYFDEAIEKLEKRYLSKTLELVIHPTPPSERADVQRAIETASAAPLPTSQQLNAQQLFQQAFAKASAENHDGAIRDYDEVIRLDPNFGMAYNNRGWSRFRKGDLRAALADYDIAARLEPTNPLIFINRGWARQQQGDFVGAINDYNVCLTYAPMNAAAYTNRGLAQQSLGNAQAALADFEAAARIDPSSPYPYYNHGNILMGWGQYDLALMDFERAIMVAPLYAYPYAGRGVCWYFKGNAWQAMADLQYSLALDPTNAFAQEWLNRIRSGGMMR
ncbi:MAG: tetratricopeptide repeat protein [Chloroflexi bacterium]|nr:tetratricopeptide repeat protein [Chloroflexota bacterium]